MTEADIILAGELALGVLDGEERAAALRRVLAEPAFAAEVTRWSRQFAGLIPDYLPASPPEGLEPTIAAATGPTERRASGWRIAAITASAIAASLVLVVAWPHRQVTPVVAPLPSTPVLIAALAGEHGKPFNAIYRPSSAQVKVVGAASWPEDRSAELWVIAPGKSPRALGLLGRGERSAVAVPGGERPTVSAGATLAVSIEPTGGSPTGSPTGPVIASGVLVSG